MKKQASIISFKALVILFLIPISSFAAVTQEHVGIFDENATYHGSSYCNSITTTGGANTVLLVGFTIGRVSPSISTANITSLTYNGDSFTLIGSRQNDINGIQVLYGLATPAAGTHDLCVGIVSGNTLALPAYVEYSGVNTTALFSPSDAVDGDLTLTAAGNGLMVAVAGYTSNTSSNGTWVQAGDASGLYSLAVTTGSNTLNVTSGDKTVGLILYEAGGGGGGGGGGATTTSFIDAASSNFYAASGFTIESVSGFFTDQLHYLLGMVIGLYTGLLNWIIAIMIFASTISVAYMAFRFFRH